MAKKKKKSFYNEKSTIVAIVVAVLLIASSVFAYFQFFSGEDETEEIKVVEEFVVDDRISPLENQAMVLEVLRIRHRGLYDALMTRGNAWKEKPKFYFKAILDDLEYISSEVESHGKVTETPFITWDTMFQENKIVRDAEEEQESSTITLTIIQQNEKGLIFKKTNDVEKDSFTVTYDYRTGHWKGDDYLKDKDGYGHYVGETFEIWFNIYQMDYDTDYIPYWTEVNVLGTDPRRDDSEKDPDGDGVSTYWEWKYGYDPLVWDDHEMLDPDVDGLENIEEYQMEKWLAEPYSQDIYVEIDYMERGGLFDPPHLIWDECQQAIIEKYSEHNIKMYFDMGWPDSPKNGGGDVLPHYEKLSQDSGMILQFYKHYFPEERRGIFRYVVASHGGPFNHPAKGNVYDAINVGYKIMPKILLKQMFTQQIPPTARGQRIKVASTLMHELGHSVGISPWTFEGCDNLSYAQGKAAKQKYAETYGNYYSVMNYFVMYDTKLLDYSHGSNGAPYDQNDWINLFVPTFQYNAELVEEIFFEPPGFDKIVYGETEIGVTGYDYDQELTEKFINEIGAWSPVDPIPSNWAVFRLKDQDEYPDYKEIKILVQPNVPYAGWAEYAEGELNEENDFSFYSAQEIINDILEEL